MAKLVVVDGPEKAGKTTLISQLTGALKSAGERVTTHHWAMPNPKTFHSLVYRDYIEEAFQLASCDVIIWDRSWVSEYVYPGLMPQMRSPRRFTWSDPWLGEWYFGRALQTYGLGLILLGPSASVLEGLRDETDHNCSASAERERFGCYGTKFGWNVIENGHCQTDSFLTSLMADRLDVLSQVPVWLRPPVYCGPPDSSVVFMGEALTTHRTPGTWLPFSSTYTTKFGREFGDQAFDYGWTNAMSLKFTGVSPGEIREFFDGKLVVACGQYATDYCNNNGLDYYPISHPAYGYRWGSRVGDYRVAIDRLKTELATRGLFSYGN